jgi:hypothetical protein
MGMVSADHGEDPSMTENDLFATYRPFSLIDNRIDNKYNRFGPRLYGGLRKRTYIQRYDC